ncbi:ABC transporter substrate-binding protein [Schaalia sp. ZJ405]|uniref:ABC transporter substrate-binding protein n=1 Tax=Schaalia sp. ZJ405 TaxID=2709403 RepID=UPI0018CA21B4|nr:sugar ABC transporter substrate-binding protein [Schaalia sp. ZJ405]
MRHLKVFAIAAASAFAMAACSAGASNEASSPSDPVELTFQSLSDQSGAIEVTKEIVDSWNKEHPNVQVKIVPAGWDGIYDKLITQFNAGAAPDIIHYEAASIVAFARDGYLADLTELLDSKFVSDVPKGVMGSVTVDDKIVAAPTELQSYVVFANKTLLDQAGVTIPTGDTMKWSELQEIAKATTKGDVFGLGWGLKSPTAAMMAMGPQFDGTFFEGTGREATIKVADGELSLPQIVHDMAFKDQTLQPLSLTQSGSEVLASFYAGQVAMTIQGSYQAANIAKDAPEGFEWVVLPPLEGSAGAKQAANPQTLSVNVDSKHAEEAAKFINYFVQAENLAKINEADALIPASAAAQDIMAKNLSDQPAWETILKSGKYMTDAPYLFADFYGQWKDTVATPAFQQYFAQEIERDQLQQQLTSGWNDISGQ